MFLRNSPEENFKYAIDEEDGAAGSEGAGDGAPPETAEAAPPPSHPDRSLTRGDASHAVAGSRATPSGDGTVPSPAPQQPSWLDNLRSRGVDVGADENAAYETLARLHQERQQLEQLRPYIPHVNNYLRDSEKYQAWQKSQKQEQTQQQEQTRQGNVWDAYWQPPEFDPRWLAQLSKDPATGNLQGPPELVAKYQAYEQYRSQQAAKLMDNPHEYLAPTVKAIAQQIAQETIQTTLRNAQQSARLQGFIDTNQDWLYEVDPQTRQAKTHTYFDQAQGVMVTGKVQSQWGRKMVAYAREIDEYQRSHNFTDPEACIRDAYARVQRDFAIHQYEQFQKGGAHPSPVPQTPGAQPAAETQQPPAPQLTPQQAANAAYLAKKNPPAAPVKKPVSGGGSVKPGKEAVNGKTIEKVMLKNLLAAGYR